MKIIKCICISHIKIDRFISFIKSPFIKANKIKKKIKKKRNSILWENLVTVESFAISNGNVLDIFLPKTHKAWLSCCKE